MKYIKLYEDIDWEDWNEEDLEEENEENQINLDEEIPSISDFKVDDRVKIIYKNKSYYATIIDKSKFNYNQYFTLEFDDYIDGHDAACRGKEGHCWNIAKIDEFDNWNDIKEKLNKL